MEFPDLYKKVAVLPKRDFGKALEKFTAEKRWKDNANIIDIGCGDGSTTSHVLLKHVPSYKKLVAFDISSNMIQYANEHFANGEIEFLTCDVTEELPLRLHNAFDHAFSSYVFQRIQKQKVAFQNTYKLLKEEGDCLLLFLGRYPVYEVLRTLSRKEKWAEDLKDVDSFTSPYHDSQDPIKDVRKLMESVGFKDVEINIYENTNTYSNEDTFKGLIKSINPFEVLNKRWDEFMADYFEVAPLPNALKIDYQLIVAYGRK